MLNIEVSNKRPQVILSYVYKIYTTNKSIEIKNKFMFSWGWDRDTREKDWEVTAVGKRFLLVMMKLIFSRWLHHSRVFMVAQQ